MAVCLADGDDGLGSRGNINLTGRRKLHTYVLYRARAFPLPFTARCLRCKQWGGSSMLVWKETGSFCLSTSG